MPNSDVGAGLRRASLLDIPLLKRPWAWLISRRPQADLLQPLADLVTAYPEEFAEFSQGKVGVVHACPFATNSWASCMCSFSEIRWMSASVKIRRFPTRIRGSGIWPVEIK